MKISLLKKGILVIVPISLISFHLFWFPGRKRYRENDAGPEAIMQVLEVIMQVPGVIIQVLEVIMQVPEEKMQVLGSNNAGPWKW